MHIGCSSVRADVAQRHTHTPDAVLYWGNAQDAGYPDINIIAEKVAAEGQTRFEDRYRLPLGISVNMTSYSGKLLTAALYNPRLIMVYAQARPPAGP